MSRACGDHWPRFPPATADIPSQKQWQAWSHLHQKPGLLRDCHEPGSCLQLSEKGKSGKHDSRTIIALSPCYHQGHQGKEAVRTPLLRSTWIVQPRGGQAMETLLRLQQARQLTLLAGFCQQAHSGAQYCVSALPPKESTRESHAAGPSMHCMLSQWKTSDRVSRGPHQVNGVEDLHLSNGRTPWIRQVAVVIVYRQCTQACGNTRTTECTLSLEGYLLGLEWS